MLITSAHLSGQVPVDVVVMQRYAQLIKSLGKSNPPVGLFFAFSFFAFVRPVK